MAQVNVDITEYDSLRDRVKERYFNEKPEIDFSILNDTDWFYVILKGDGYGHWMLKGIEFDGEGRIKSDLSFLLTDCRIYGSTKGTDSYIGFKRDIEDIRKATPEDLAPMFEKYSELEPKKVDFSILNDADIFYLKSEHHTAIFRGSNPFTERVKFYEIELREPFICNVCSKRDVIELRKATEAEKGLYYEAYPELAPPSLGDWIAVWDGRDKSSIAVVKYLYTGDEDMLDVWAGRYCKIDPDKPLRPQIDEFLEQEL